MFLLLDSMEKYYERSGQAEKALAIIKEYQAGNEQAG